VTIEVKLQECSLSYDTGYSVNGNQLSMGIGGLLAQRTTCPDLQANVEAVKTGTFSISADGRSMTLVGPEANCATGSVSTTFLRLN
jgi:hypothetical protein